MDKVIITGWVNNVEQYIPAFDIAVLPSKWEGFGLVLIEYMACNKPIIATSVGGIKDIIENEVNGILVPKESPEKLKYAIQKILKRGIKYSTTGEQYKLIMRKYDIETVIDNHKTIFKRIK